MLYDWRNRLATHQPVLAAAVAATRGPIAEFGSGHASTPLLHRLAARTGRRLVTLDSNEAWLDKFRPTFESPLHEFRLVTDWKAELERPEWQQAWSVVFVDQDGFEARASTVAALRLNADYMVVHDCDYFPREGLFGREIAPLLGEHEHGARDYSDVFSSWREYFPPEPWPFKPTGPPTLLGSNRLDATILDVRYELPLWWRVGRHARRLAPQRMRMRVANLIDWGTSRYADAAPRHRHHDDAG